MPVQSRPLTVTDSGSDGLPRYESCISTGSFSSGHALTLLRMTSAGPFLNAMSTSSCIRISALLPRNVSGELKRVALLMSADRIWLSRLKRDTVVVLA